LDRDRSYLTKPGASQETLNALPPKLIDLISKRRMLGVRKDRLAKTLSIKLDTINDIEAGRIDVTNDFFASISENVDKLGADRRGSARLDEANDLLEDADRDIRRLVLRRKAYGIHQLEVAHELFLSLATISDIELRRVGLSPAFEEKYASVIDKLSKLSEHPQHPLRRKRFATPETDRIAQAVLDLTMKRKQLGIGQLRLAITLNLSPTTLADFECGLLELSDATKSRIERTIENLNQADRGGSHGLR
jgi:transcriptional regulator with XRE-family HTH domain